MGTARKQELTDRLVKRQQVAKDEDGNPVLTYLWDIRIKGFGLRITPNGVKSFCLKYREPGPRNPKPQRWLPLGLYDGPESVEKARKRATEAREQIANGLDPRIERQKRQEVPTLRDFVETFLGIQKGRLRPGSYKPAKSMLEKLVVPVLGDFKITEIQQGQVNKLFRDVSRGWRPGMKAKAVPANETPIRANRMLAALRKLFSVAEREGLFANQEKWKNPCLFIDKNPEATGNERYLTATEFEWLGKVLKDAPNWGDREACPYAYDKAKKRSLKSPTIYALAALKLLMFTGARLNEVLQLRWEQIDEARGVIVIPRHAHKTGRYKGPKELPLNSAALGVLAELSTLPTRAITGGWVIQGHKHGEHMVNLQKPWERVRKAAGLASKGAVDLNDVRLHDLRHSFASVGVGLKLSLHQVGDLLGHTQASTTIRYAHLDADPRIAASEAIATKISQALG